MISAAFIWEPGTYDQEFNELNALIEEVATTTPGFLGVENWSSLPKELKAQVARCLKRILDSLDEYYITGGVGILEASETALGHASVDSEYKSFLQDTEVGQRALDAIAAAANLLTVSVGIPQLTVVLTQLLT